MPLHIEWIESPSAQDWIDLDKLYKDAPNHWFADQAIADAKGYISHKKELGYRVAVGRFNDRLIAAAALQPHEDKQHQHNGFELEDLCVRSITQDRGVARQLIVRICQWADEFSHTLWVEDISCLYKVLEDYQFAYNNGRWRRITK